MSKNKKRQMLWEKKYFSKDRWMDMVCTGRGSKTGATTIKNNCLSKIVSYLFHTSIAGVNFPPNYTEISQRS